MSTDYKKIETPELKRLWEAQRNKVVNHSHTQGDLDELFAMKKELDRRKGEKNPIVDINFEQHYTTD